MLKFIKLKEKYLEKLLCWRTSPEVTKYMFTDIEYDLIKQKLWFETVSDDPNNFYWVIEMNGRSIGLVSLNNIQWRDRRCYWGYYIGESDARIYGGLIGPYVYRYVFEELGFKKIMGEVMEGNESVRKMQIIQGCREVGVLKDHIYKYNKYHDVYVLELLDSDWIQLRDRYDNCLAEFER